MPDKVETGGVVSGLFAGMVEEDLVFPFPEMNPDERENVELLLDSFRKFASKEIDSQRIDEQGFIPEEVKSGLAELGVMGVTFPEEYGGFGWSTTAYCRMMEEVSLFDASIATHIGGHLSLGSKGILLHGTEEQKKRFLPKIASGEWTCAYALTEPQAGSDAQSMKSRAEFDPARGVWILNGSKIWCTNGGYAHVIQTFARTPLKGGREKITAFIVTRDLPGFSSGKPEYKMGIKGSNTVELSFTDVPVPPENIIGEPGKGFKIALEILNTGRLSLAAGCAGGIKESLKRALEHAEQRRQFGRPIVEFEMLKEKFAEMAVDAYALESMVYLASGLADRGVDATLEAAICKVWGTEAMWRAANHAVQIAGGSGFMREYPYERAVRDCRVNMIFEGTNEILRVMIALTGMQKRGEHLRGGAAATSGSAGKIGFVVDALQDEAAALTQQAAELAKQVEAVSRTHRRRIVEREYIQHRIADAAMELYAMLAVLARTSGKVAKEGADGAAREIRLTKVFCDGAWRRARRSIRAIERNMDADTDLIVDDLRASGGYSTNLI